VSCPASLAAGVDPLEVFPPRCRIHWCCHALPARPAGAAILAVFPLPGDAPRAGETAGFTAARAANQSSSRAASHSRCCCWRGRAGRGYAPPSDNTEHLQSDSASPPSVHRLPRLAHLGKTRTVTLSTMHSYIDLDVFTTENDSTRGV
jgi:hypothetical protein